MTYKIYSYNPYGDLNLLETYTGDHYHHRYTNRSIELYDIHDPGKVYAVYPADKTTIRITYEPPVANTESAQ